MKSLCTFKVLVLVNKNANKGNAAQSWKRIKPRVLDQLPNDTIVLEDYMPGSGTSILKEIVLENNINCVISVGGDGTLNCLLNNLISNNNTPTDNLYIGAIGLGSSNDYHKPVTNAISGFPIRINFDKAAKCDLGKVTYINQKGVKASRYFIINASLGATAEANLFFNTGNRLLNFLKRRAVSLAILYAAIKTIFSYKNFPAVITSTGNRETIRISNLGIIKNPNVSGNLRYDQSITQDDGRLGLNYCHDMNRRELMKTLSDMAKGKFSGHAKRFSSFIKSVQIDTRQIVALETDGEVFQGKNFKFSLIPGAINTLGA